MFKKEQDIILSILFSAVFISLLFSLNSGSRINVSASGAPNYVLGNQSLSNNLTASQISELSDQIVNYTKPFVQKSGDNLTLMNMLLINDLESRNIINATDKQELLSLNNALGGIKPTSNLTLIDEEVSSLLEEMATNSSNPLIVTLKSELN